MGIGPALLFTMASSSCRALMLATARLALCDEAIVTNDFPVFNVVENRLLPTYLGWMCRTASFVEECKRASEGTTNRVRLQEDKFLAREIPLPPLAEQRRVVARIEELAAQIHEAPPFATKPPKKPRRCLHPFVGQRSAKLRSPIGFV
jgi:restriction endonuclease S subunit